VREILCVLEKAQLSHGEKSSGEESLIFIVKQCDAVHAVTRLEAGGYKTPTALLEEGC
jgi:hypothetical protein